MTPASIMPAHARSAEASTDRRAVLIGTPQTLCALAAQHAALPNPAAEIIGVVVIDAHDRHAPELASLPWPVLGGADDLPRLHERFGFPRAVLSVPCAMDAASARVAVALRQLGVGLRLAPTLADLLAPESMEGPADQPGMIVPSQPRLDPAMLIGRPPRALDERAARALLRGRRVLITGAGGSIGSELARAVARLEPSMLILMDRAENPLFEIDREIAARNPALPRQAVLHDVVDAPGTLRRLVSLRPDVVFHAAAHKHVPMMQEHPSAALTNNLLGTRSIADASRAVGVSRFVMISTDKAVNPSSVMGATKRLAELYVRSLNHRDPRGHSHHAPGTASSTHFSLVRFGNVLGSACSVLPIWAKQIAEGGPITVTHPEMTRYFMTIPEAATLVIHAAALGIDGSTDRKREVFVLDMGQPISILGLARRFAASLGFGVNIESDDSRTSLGETGVDRRQFSHYVRLTFTGSRPGEKLHEELAYASEDLQTTSVSGVMAWSQDDREVIDPAVIDRTVHELSELRDCHDADVVQRALTAALDRLQYDRVNCPPSVTAA